MCFKLSTSSWSSIFLQFLCSFILFLPRSSQILRLVQHIGECCLDQLLLLDVFFTRILSWWWEIRLRGSSSSERNQICKILLNSKRFASLVFESSCFLIAVIPWIPVLCKSQRNCILVMPIKPRSNFGSCTCVILSNKLRNCPPVAISKFYFISEVNFRRGVFSLLSQKLLLLLESTSW